MQRLHTYPDIRAMFRRLLIATVTGVLAALAVAVFRHACSAGVAVSQQRQRQPGECRRVALPGDAH
jgi:hypothetical protein